MLHDAESWSRASLPPLEIALVNNMPDQALAATCNQFSRLVRRGAVGQVFRLRCYTLPSVERSETAKRYLARSHESVEALYRRGADALIVTGAEPKAAALRDEPYWGELTRLIDWARANTSTAIWSCLASHAAVLHLDGIERRRLKEKLSGVFSFTSSVGDWFGQGGASASLTPHSRYNELRGDELEAHGYTISSASPQFGVNAFWRREPSLFLFLQGHPEYDRDSLLKEYRRDAIRFIDGVRSGYPEAPQNYFNAGALAHLEQLQRSIGNTGFDAREALNAAMAMSAAPAMPWNDDAVRLYRNWIAAALQESTKWRVSA